MRRRKFEKLLMNDRYYLKQLEKKDPYDLIKILYEGYLEHIKIDHFSIEGEEEKAFRTENIMRNTFIHVCELKKLGAEDKIEITFIFQTRSLLATTLKVLRINGK